MVIDICRAPAGALQISGVVIGFTMSAVTVSEDVGSMEVVVSATGASVSGSVMVGVSTVDQSAIGMYM